MKLGKQISYKITFSMKNSIYCSEYILSLNFIKIRCDRILWRGDGIDQLSYIRGESRLSDHRPVCAVFSVEVEESNKNNSFRKGYSCAGRRLDFEDCIPKRHSLYEF